MQSGLLDLLRTSLLIVGALFPIVNPLGNAPIFLALTRGFSSSTRAMLARRIALNGFILLISSILIGTHILAFFGISLPVVQVAGGMVVIATGWALLNQKDEDAGSGQPEQVSQAAISMRAFYPLTLPLTVGPGSISVAITVGANRPEGAQSNWPILLAEVVGPALIAASIYLCYKFAERIADALGETAMSVILRLSSFILLCIGVQIGWNGIRGLLGSVR
jgi:multiple antibiotic resistance protein